MFGLRSDNNGIGFWELCDEGFHESYLLCSKMPKEAKGGPTDDFSSCNRDQGNGGQRLPEQVVGDDADGQGIVHEGCCYNDYVAYKRILPPVCAQPPKEANWCGVNAGPDGELWWNNFMEMGHIQDKSSLDGQY